MDVTPWSLTLTSLRVVLRDRGDVAALPHVVETLAAYLDNFSHTSTVPDAAERGFVHLLSILADRQAAREPDFPELLFDFNDALTRAARRGHIETMQWLLKHRPDDLIPAKAMDEAAEGGHLEIVKWLHGHDRAEGCTKQAMNGAAADGHLEVVRWLHENRTEGCSMVALTSAAAGGHVGVVQFLVEHREEGDATMAMTTAASHGHLHVVRWLGGTRAKMSSPDELMTLVQWLARREKSGSSLTMVILDNAAVGGNLHVIKWLIENGIDHCTTAAMDEAAGCGHLEIVRWLHENRSEGCTAKAMDQASRNGHLEVVRYLHANRTEGCTRQAMGGAAAYGHIEVLRFLHDHRSEGAPLEAMMMAASNGHLHVVQWLHANLPSQVWALGAIEWAASAGHLEVLKWLDENRPERCPAFVLSTVARRGDVAVMTYLLSHSERLFRTSVRPPMLDAIEYGHLEIVRLIHTMFPQHPVHPTEVECAVLPGDLKLVQWLYEHRCPAATCSPRVMDEVAGMGHLATLRWLIEHKDQKCTNDAITEAASGGHLEVIRYLYTNGHAGCTTQAMEHAVGGNHARVVKWLVANCPQQFYTKRALEAAIETAQRRRRKVLSAWLTKSLQQLEADTTNSLVPSPSV